MKNREKILNTIGLSLLLICFVFALYRVFTRQAEQRDPNVINISFAHWQLESGIREAFQAISDEYMREFPHVRIRQIDIPERVFPTWLTVQLVGEQAPDLIQLGRGRFGLTEDRLARFFVPLTEWVEQPNPFNEGTHLEGIPWRETFVDGLTADPAFNEQLLEIYGIPNALFTIRIFYNQDLWDEIFGDREVPQTLEEFIEICEGVLAYSEDTGNDIFPIAGSRYNAPQLLGDMFQSQTQMLALTASPQRSLRGDQNEVLLDILRGRRVVGDSPFREGFKLMADVSQYMQPGFNQLGREDASFRFLQGTMLMIASGSWDASSLHAEAPFNLGAFAIPFPTRDHPEFGETVLGPTSERGLGTGAAFGLYRGSANIDQTIHFLQYLTSLRSATLFGEISGWLPSVEGVEVPEIIQPFQPRLDGYPAGISLGGAPERNRIMENYSHLLAAQQVDRFVEEVQSRFPRAIRTDLSRAANNQLNNVMRQDSTFVGYDLLREHVETEALVNRLTSKMVEIAETQVGQETLSYYLRHELELTSD